MWELIQKYEAKTVELLLTYGPKVILAAFFLYLGLNIINWLAKAFHNRLTKKLAYEKLPSRLNEIFIWLLRGVLLISVASMLGIETASFVAVIAAISLTIGLALQGALTNFASGVLLLLLRPFKVGDYVEIDKQVGFVKSIDVFYTTLITPLNVTIIIPNAAVAKTRISNFSTLGIVILELKVGVKDPQKITEAKLIIEEVLDKCAKILAEPHCLTVISEITQDEITLLAKPWVKTLDYWDTYYELVAALHLELQNRQIAVSTIGLDKARAL